MERTPLKGGETVYLTQTRRIDRGICQKVAPMGWGRVGESGFEVLRLALQRVRQPQRRGPKRVIINYRWLPSLWKSGGRRHQMCGRGRGAKGLSLSSQKQCSNLAVMHFCLIDCFDAGFFLLHFVFEGALMPPHSPVLLRRTWWAFSVTQQEPSGGSLMARKAPGDLRGLHLCIGTVTLHFWFLTRNEWGEKVMYGRHTVRVCECMCYMVYVCVCVRIRTSGRVVLFCVCVRLQWKGEARDPQTTWGVS